MGDVSTDYKENSKKFWSFIKSKGQEWTGVAPLNIVWYGLFPLVGQLIRFSFVNTDWNCSFNISALLLLSLCRNPILFFNNFTPINKQLLKIKRLKYIPLRLIWKSSRFLPSIVAEKNATKNEHICSMCIETN
jgi:hypothetical protein